MRRPKTRDVARKRTIPWLAWHIQAFNEKRISKASLAAARVAIADRLIAQSYPVRERL